MESANQACPASHEANQTARLPIDIKDQTASIRISFCRWTPAASCRQNRLDVIFGTGKGFLATAPGPASPVGRSQGVELTGFFQESLHATVTTRCSGSVPRFRASVPVPDFPRVIANASVPTGRESAERRQEFSFVSRRRRHPKALLPRRPNFCLSLHAPAPGLLFSQRKQAKTPHELFGGKHCQFNSLATVPAFPIQPN